MKSWFRLGTAALVLLTAVGANAAQQIYNYTFDTPMSWADDICPWADYKVQEWEIAKGGNPGNALRINGAAWERTETYEVRTLQFNHKPGTPVSISFDFKAVSNPAGSSFMVRYFDGWCGAQAFTWCADDQKHPFPKPIFEMKQSKPGWQKVSFTTPTLKNTVVTFAFFAQQPEWKGDPEKPKYLDYYIDNLKVSTTALDKLMDSDFDWYGIHGGTTFDFRRNTRAAATDWCDFADQEIVKTPDGDIRFTMFQFRDATNQQPGARHELKHDLNNISAGGQNTLTLKRSFGAGNHSAASWGARQTVDYSSLGLKSGQSAKIRVKMKVSNYHEGTDATACQLGVDPYGGVATQKATWTNLDPVSIYSWPGWSTHELVFDRPKDAGAFTIYFRQRDGIAQDARDASYPPEPNEPQSQGAFAHACESYADWVMVEVVK